MGKIIAPIAALLEQAIKILYGILGNYGLAIIGVTILIKVVLLPLTLKQDKSMKDMKKIQPELDALKQKYGNDPQVLNQKTMELYQKHKVNPLSGCLPILVQLPILWALFAVLRKTAAEGGVIPMDATFIGLALNTPDPRFILPVLNGVVSYAQQKLMSGTGAGGQQAKMMMYTFPVMMVMISYRMPAGLQIYWLTSSLLGVLQQYFIMNRGEKA